MFQRVLWPGQMPDPTSCWITMTPDCVPWGGKACHPSCSVRLVPSSQGTGLAPQLEPCSSSWQECSEEETGYSSEEAENEEDEDDTEEAEEDEDEEEEMLLPGMEGKEEVRVLLHALGFWVAAPS